ncbi:MAG: hypothetical protein QOE81_1487 [Verrucomicrobiota bacterium]
MKACRTENKEGAKEVGSPSGAHLRLISNTQENENQKIDMKKNQKISMETNQPTNNVEESTYALLVRSEDKKHALFETVLYGLVAVGVLIAILQFADQPVSFGA